MKNFLKRLVITLFTIGAIYGAFNAIFSDSGLFIKCVLFACVAMSFIEIGTKLIGRVNKLEAFKNNQ